MNKHTSKIKNILYKDITNFVVKNRVPLISILILVLLACVGLVATYAFYQVKVDSPIIGGSTSKLADLDIRIMAEERDSNGNGLNSYGLYPYIPKAGYVYNSEMSYCTNGSTITYNSDTFDADIVAYGHDVCYLYFDSVAQLDITLNVYAENVNSDGYGTGEYTKLETTALPSIGYELNTTKSGCENGSLVTYDPKENQFSVEASNKDVCNAYMDAMDVDIALKIYVQVKKNSDNYYEAKSIPTNAFYELSDKSACTGTSTMSIKNQRVVIAATSRTSCVAYLDVGSGPILESMKNNLVSAQENESVTINLINSNLGTSAVMYYFSKDNGVTYVSSSTSSYTFSNLTPLTDYTFKAYSVDASGKQSGIITTTTKTGYYLNKPFDYSSNVQSFDVVASGYYKLEVWGAQGGSYNESYAAGGLGGYSVGVIYLNVGDKIYVTTGGKGNYCTTSSTNVCDSGGTNGGGNAGYRGGGGGGGTDIRINDASSLYARVIVAGGGGGAYSYSTSYKAAGGAAGGLNGLAGAYYSSTYSTWAGGGATQTAGGTGGTGSITSYYGKAGTFGVGGDTGNKYSSASYYSSGAGGGGWYGGGGSGHYNTTSRTRAVGGGGGSGFINTATATKPSGYLYNDTYLIISGFGVTAKLYSGTDSFASPSDATETGHSGNGYARVTFVGTEL